MPWLLCSVSAAFMESFKDVLGKQSLKSCDEYVVSWSLRFFGLFVVLPVLAFVPIPHLGENFGWALLAGGFLNVMATLLYIKAIKHSDLSFLVPFVTLSPLFLLFTSLFMVGGAAFFGEENLKHRLTGTLLMLAGVWLIAMG